MTELRGLSTRSILTGSMGVSGVARATTEKTTGSAGKKIMCHQIFYFMKILTTLLMAIAFISVQAQQIPSREIQIQTALLAAPTEDRENATVYGYSEKGEFIVLRKGTNEMVCLADDPAQQNFNVSCYHKDLDP